MITRTHALKPDFELRIGEALKPPDLVEARVDEIWTEEKQKKGDQLTNGRTYSLTQVFGDRLVMQPTEYRYVLARYRAPELVRAGLNIRPLGVTGLFLCSDGLAVGLRNRDVATYSGVWEPVPSGSLSHSDPLTQVLEELEQELGVKADRVERLQVCGVVEDLQSGVSDFVIRMHAGVTKVEILSTFGALSTKEHTELQFLDLMSLHRFLRTHHDRLLPAFEPMLHLAHLL